MSQFGELYFPRATPEQLWEALSQIRGSAPSDIEDLSFDLSSAQFHPAGHQRVKEEQLLAWRLELNQWARAEGFPQDLNTKSRIRWDVSLGTKLASATEALPERNHPAVWAWLAANLFPHFVAYRWDWPNASNETGKHREVWSRFGWDLRNGLRLATHRIQTYGAELTQRASEQEFQSIQYRPAFGLDARVARIVLQTMVDALDDPHSNYGKHGGTRTLDANDVCIELRLVNSLRPFCFMSDEQIAEVVTDTIQLLPQLRGRTTTEEPGRSTGPRGQNRVE